MKVVCADSDLLALAETAESLKSVFSDGDVVTFTDAMNTYKYCVNNLNDIAAVFITVILKPFDGLKLRELISTLPVPINVVFVLREESGEMLELISINGASARIVKPVTREKVEIAAKTMVDDCWAEDCSDCALFWCKSWRGKRGSLFTEYAL